MDPIWFTAQNGVRVRITDNTLQHMAAHPIAFELLEEAIAKSSPGRERSWGGSVDLERIVGKENRISVPQVGLDDTSLFALRHNRKRPTHTSLAAQPTETSNITLIVNDLGRYGGPTLISAWFGTLASPEPRSLQSKEHLEYWCKNALLWNDQDFASVPFFSTWRRVLTNQWKDDMLE
jgi:hypothetical protein